MLIECPDCGEMYDDEEDEYCPYCGDDYDGESYVEFPSGPIDE